ncbi:excinuclease ABC subunit UvrA [Nocardioides fonticola]|uniref:UvrABC system protein A n=1 Tax=Nocardioides fonticola TaxID=450363 RepID=A0ABP7XV28_9ACTN
MTLEPLHPADQHDVIRVEGARENNLQGIDLTLPKRRLTVFTGVSGSGKSSLVFGTIAAESQRMINETYSAFVQGFMPSLDRPDVDRLEGLTAAIVVGQEPMVANARSTVGTVTDAHTMLRSLYSRLSEPYVGPPTAFSFNVPTRRASGVRTTEKADGRVVRDVVRDVVYLGGMCAQCEGRGSVSDLDLSVILDESRSLQDGAILVPGYTADGWMVAAFKAVVPPDVPVRDLTPKQRDDLLHAEPRKVKVENVNVTFEGLLPKIRKSMFSKDPDSLQPHVRAFVERAATFGVCPECGGSRLNEAARTARVHGRTLPEVCAMQISDAAQWIRSLDDASVAPLRTALVELLDAFDEIGLGYLSLDRPSGSLSGGEAQRTRMIRHLGSALTDITYVFDEPTVGLHPHDIDRMNRLLLQLRDKGNTVLVVEHKPETITIADHVVDLGPGAGSGGGEVCFEGTVEALRTSGTLTGRHLAHRVGLKQQVRTPSGRIEVRGADRHNLQDVDVDIPLGVLCVVTGVAGSGKSSLVHGSVVGREDVVVVDQSTIRGSRRSNPATYTGVLEPVRKAFAKANGVKPALFSANSEGACSTCNGNGMVYTELSFMETVATLCEECQGRRFQPAVLELTLAGLSIADVFDLTVADALRFFSAAESKVPQAAAILQRLDAVGLGYIRLGQPLSSLSGGERQRLKLAVRMAEPGGVVVLDEPTTGLHLADVDHLLALLDDLVDGGRSVIVIEHHQAVMAHADWIIDLGPGAGHDGGRIVFEGTPSALVADGTTLTARHLAAYIGRDD